MSAPRPMSNKELLGFLVEHGLTVVELARLLAVTPKTIKRWSEKNCLTQCQRFTLLGLRIAVLSDASRPVERTPTQAREFARIDKQRAKQLEAA